jgi:hypothetical protein
LSGPARSRRQYPESKQRCGITVFKNEKMCNFYVRKGRNMGIFVENYTKAFN